MMFFKYMRNTRGYGYIFVIVIAFVLAASMGAMYLQQRGRRVGLSRKERLIKLQAVADGAIEVFALKLKVLPYEFRDALEARDEENEKAEWYHYYVGGKVLEPDEMEEPSAGGIFGGENSRIGQEAYFMSDRLDTKNGAAVLRDVFVSVTDAGIDSHSLGSFMDAVYRVSVACEVEGSGGKLLLNHTAKVRLGTRDEKPEITE